MNNLERLRISKNLSRPKLSEISGVPSSTINKLEKGFNNIKAAKGYTLHKLAVAMNTTIEYLINDGNFNEYIDKESYELKNKAFEDFSYLIEKYGDSNDERLNEIKRSWDIETSSISENVESDNDESRTI